MGLRTQRTNWTFTDADGFEWHEFPHAEDSWGLVGYGPSEAMVADLGEHDDVSCTVTADAIVECEGDWPLDALQAVVARALAWVEVGGMPEGTVWLPREPDEDEQEDEDDDT